MATVEKYLDSERRSQLTAIVTEATAEFMGGSSDLVHAALAKYIVDEVDGWIRDLVTEAVNTVAHGPVS